MQRQNYNREKFCLICDTSWHTTIHYYRQINELVNEAKGDKVNPPLLIFNLNQEEIHDLQRKDDWEAIAKIYLYACKR